MHASTQAQDIAHIVADGRPGGGSTMVLGLIDDLCAATPHRVTLVSQPGSHLEQQARERGLPFIGFDFFGTGPDPSIPWRLARRLGTRNFDLTHVHGLRAAHHAVRWPVRDHLGQLVYTVHGLHQLHMASWLRALANRADRYVMSQVAEVVFVSHADAAAARQWALLGPRTTSRVIYNGVELTPMQSMATATRDHDAAFVGRLVEQKNPEQAARVLARLASSGARCLMVGGGPLQERCRSVLQQHPGGGAVQCVGEQTHEHALTLLARSQLLIMPSRWEGLPILPIEAMALGVPIVATRVPGTAEVVEDGQTGLLVPPGDDDAMFRAARKLIDDSALYRRLVACGRTRVARLFSRTESSAAYQTLYEDVRTRAAP